MADTALVSVKLIKSLAKRTANHKANASGLGLKRLNQTVTVKKTPENMGMINKIYYMVQVEDIK